MRAIVHARYGPPEVLQLEEVERPTPKSHEVLVRVRAAIVSTTDCAARRGGRFIERLAFGLIRPRNAILGSEFAGVIEAVGHHVTRFNVGGQVVGATGGHFGAHAEYVCLPEDGALTIKPTTMTYEEAAAVCEGGLTALPFLRDAARLRYGQKVLIIGASGAVGSCAVQLAKYFGADVTGVCSTANLELVKSLGADKVADYTKEDVIQSGETYDIVFDTVGKSSLARCKGALKRHGVYLSTVLTLKIVLQMLRTSAFGRKKAKIALTGLRPPREKTEDLRFLTHLVEQGALKPVIDSVYPFEQTAEAHRLVETGHKKGSVVITFERRNDA